MILDIIYPIDGLPKAGELSNIQAGISRATGGAVCNVIMDLAKLDEKLCLNALGRVGKDPEGDFILNELNKHKNINTQMVIREGITSFTAVMADLKTSQRTFFHYRGANAEFSEKDVDFSLLNSKIFHIGYVLLLDSLDEEDEEYGSKMARLLHNAQKSGLATSFDVVSESSNRFLKYVPPAMKYADYCIINEIEAQNSTGIILRDDKDNIILNNIPHALSKMKQMGVSKWAVIHSAEGGYGLDEQNNYYKVDSARLPKGFIKGTVGAGDAFCSGVLYGAHENIGLEQSLEYGTAAAICSLSEPGASEGVLPIAQCMEVYERYR